MTKSKIEIKKRRELPEILYEAPSYPGEETSPIPYIECDKENEMPCSLFLFEYFDTGEVEIDENGKPAKIIEQIPHHYIDMNLLKKVLTPEELDRVRVALGMKPLAIAQSEGKAIIDKVMSKEKELKEKAILTQEERINLHKKSLENRKKNSEN
jgi:hypothetical protein